MATTSYDRKQVEASPFRSAGRRLPPPPATPYFTEKILTLASSCERNNNRDGDYSQSQHNHLPPPASPTDSVAQAMKNDLEELIGYIDNLAFEQKGDEKSAVPVPTTRARTTPSKNPIKQLFPGDENNNNASYDNHATRNNRNVVFRDRTNRFVANVGQNNNTLLEKQPQDPEVAATTKPPRHHEQPSSVVNSIVYEREPKMLEPVGNTPRREEPAGSPPSREASLYFHDESLSLNLSQSQDADNSNISDHEQDVDRSERTSTRLLSTLQKSWLSESPERSKTISFGTVSKDPMPSRALRSTSTDNTNFDSNNDEDESSELPSTSARRQATPFHRNRNRNRDVDPMKQDSADRKGNEWWRVRPTTPLDSNPTPRDFSLLDSKDVSFAIETNNNDGKSLKWGESLASPIRGQPHYTVKGTPHPSSRREDRSNIDVNENNDGKSLKWGESVAASSREPQFTVKGTPHPSSRRNDRSNMEIGDAVLETPMQPHQGQKSNLVLTSSDSAKKLLRNAMQALQDARKERDEARQWATDMKSSVNEWVEDQRRLICTNSASTSDNNNNSVSAAFTFSEQKHRAIEDSVIDLYKQIKVSKSDTDTQLHTMIVKQDEQMRELSRQLTSVKEQLSHAVVKEDASKKIRSRSNNNTDAPAGLSHKTPTTNNMTAGLTRTGSRSETSNTSSRGSHRTRRSTPSGGHLIDYGNGVKKELHADGTTVTRFQNGDVETRFNPNTTSTSSGRSPSLSCMVAYYHCKEEVLQITQKDGSVLYEYANGQVERHCVDGVKIVLFPDGTKTIV